MSRVTLSQLRPERLYRVLCRCRRCGRQLNQTRDALGVDLRRDWATIALAAPIGTPRCPAGCQTPEDLKAPINELIVLEIEEAREPRLNFRTKGKINLRRSDPRHPRHADYCALSPRCDEVPLLVDRLLRHGVKL